MVSGQVVVSKTFQLDNACATKQLRMNRNQLVLRADHFVAFLVVTGLHSIAVQDKLFQRMLHLPKGQSEKEWALRNAPKSKKSTNLPLKASSSSSADAKTNPFMAVFPGWSIPRQVKYSTIGLCKSLNRLLDPLSLREPPKKEDEVGSVTVYWEREEYQGIVDHLKNTWPDKVVHQPLKLVRNRYPVVPGFDGKERKDIVQILGQDAETIRKQAQTVVVKRSDFKKKRTTWKVKNEIVKAPNVLHRYASRNGKSYPIIKTTAETSRYRQQREAKQEEKEKARLTLPTVKTKHGRK